MKRAALLIAIACFAQPRQNKPVDDPVKITVGAGKVITVEVPRIAKADLVSIAASFFAKGDKELTAKFNKLLSEAPEITLVLTSK